MILGLLLDALIAVVCVFLVVVLIIVFVPYYYRVSYKYKNMQQKIIIEFNIGKAFGFYLYQEGIIGAPIIKNIQIFGHVFKLNESKNKNIDKDNDTAEEASKEKAAKAKKQSKDISVTEYIDLMNKQLMESFIQVIADIIKILAPKTFWFYTKVGFYEPHYTSIAYGIGSVIKGLVKSYNIDIIPIWDDEYLEVDTELSGRFVLAIIIYRLIKFLLSKPTRTLWKQWRKLKKQHSFA